MLFRHQVNETNKNKLSFKMGVIFTSSTYMDENMSRYIVKHSPEVLELNNNRYKDKTHE